VNADPLLEEQAAARAQIEALTREFDGVVAASRSSNADDEHDPEGATIAFERQQVVALLDQARRRLADVEAALARRAAGDYGTCETCGRPIAPERLAARPAARHCIGCAGGNRR
jgi:RNA polymerase-binding transcription factor DksA